jgi:hypothetical protein
VPSKEHAISKGIAAAINPSIKAVTFTAGGSLEVRQTIGVNSLALPILCKRHNGELSPTDDEAARFFSGLSRLTTRALPDTGFLTKSGQAVLKLNGSLFERWAAKTFFNLVLAGIPHSRDKAPLLGLTGVQIAEQVFNGIPFPGRHGLYGLPLGTNLMRAPPLAFHTAPMTLTILSMDVNHRKHGQHEWNGPYRMPVFLYIAASGFEFLLHANLTALCNADWDALVAARWNDPTARVAVRHPECTSFDLPELDGPPIAWRRRLVGFTW